MAHIFDIFMKNYLGGWENAARSGEAENIYSELND